MFESVILPLFIIELFVLGFFFFKIIKLCGIYMRRRRIIDVLKYFQPVYQIKSDDLKTHFRTSDTKDIFYNRTKRIGECYNDIKEYLWKGHRDIIDHIFETTLNNSGLYNENIGKKIYFVDGKGRVVLVIHNKVPHLHNCPNKIVFELNSDVYDYSCYLPRKKAFTIVNDRKEILSSELTETIINYY